MMTHLGVIFSCPSVRLCVCGVVVLVVVVIVVVVVVCRRWIISHFIQSCGMDDE